MLISNQQNLHVSWVLYLQYGIQVIRYLLPVLLDPTPSQVHIRIQYFAEGHIALKNVPLRNYYDGKMIVQEHYKITKLSHSPPAAT